MTDMQAIEAEAPVEAPAEPIEQSTPESTPETDDRAALSEIWRKHQERGIEDEGEAEEAEAEDTGRDEKGRFKPRQPAEGNDKPAKKEKRKMAPKYRNAAGQEWCGRGAMPKWMRDEVGSGANKEDFLIAA